MIRLVFLDKLIIRKPSFHSHKFIYLIFIYEMDEFFLKITLAYDIEMKMLFSKQAFIDERNSFQKIFQTFLSIQSPYKQEICSRIFFYTMRISKFFGIDSRIDNNNVFIPIRIFKDIMRDRYLQIILYFSHKEFLSSI